MHLHVRMFILVRSLHYSFLYLIPSNTHLPASLYTKAGTPSTHCFGFDSVWYRISQNSGTFSD